VPEYLSPGVYVEEVDSALKPIEGVSTSTTGFAGMAERGPTVGVPVLVTSFTQYQRTFGGYFRFSPTATFDDYRYLPHAVEGFFNNGGQRLYIARVAPGTATVAQATTLGGMVTRLQSDTAIDPVAAQMKLTPLSLRGIQVGTKLQLRMVKDGVTTDSGVLAVASIDRSSGEVTVGAAISTTVVFQARFTTVFTDIDLLQANGLPSTLATPTTARSASFVLQAANKGSWGRNIVVQTSHESAARVVFDSWLSGAAGATRIKLKSTAGFYKGAWVEVDRGKTKHYYQVTSVDGITIVINANLTAADFKAELVSPDDIVYVATCEFRLSASFGNVNERYTGLTLENIPGRHFIDQISGSSLISPQAWAGATHPFFFPSGQDGVQTVLDTNGSDGTAAPTESDIIGADTGPGQRSGLNALKEIDAISIIAAPGLTTQNIQNALITQCELLRYRFAILDPKPGSQNKAPTLDDIQNQRKLYDTKYAAIYYPRTFAFDPLLGSNIQVPPSGQMAGIYARTDDTRGVHKAPANEIVLGATDLEVLVQKAEQDILNPEPMNINVIRDFRNNGRGIRVWGARCITSNSEWKYINVRRLFIFLERSLDLGTQYLVFEPNDEKLWARVRQAVSQFLTTVWRDGALMGTKPSEAFFVRCDRTTMSQDDLDNGRLIIIVGVAPVKPAEFVIFRIGQWDGGSAVQEL